MMNSSPVRSDKNRGRRHERLGEAWFVAVTLPGRREYHRAESDRGGRRKNPSDVPPRTAACRATIRRHFNQTCSIIHVVKGVPTTHGRGENDPERISGVAQAMGNRDRAMIG
jgi:hypothetical protein